VHPDNVIPKSKLTLGYLLASTKFRAFISRAVCLIYKVDSSGFFGDEDLQLRLN